MRFNDALPDPFDDRDPDLEAALDEDFDLGDGTADTEATVICPYCGQPNEVGVDPGGGATQEYVEDCQVCCRPWRVIVSYDVEGVAWVSVEANDE
jgi:hypothetical protein